MKGRVRVPLFVVSLALLGLIGLLATLQYRWLGRISEAERDRMRATLETGAAAFAQDFDAELTRAYLLFQSDPLADTDDRATRFGARYDRWQATSKFPRVLRNIYAFTPGVNGRLERFDPGTRTFHETDWPPTMRDWRTHFTDERSEQASAPRGGTFFIRRIAPPIWEGAAAIVVPSPLLDVQAGGPPGLIYTILQLDRQYITDGMLPALVEQHFTRISGSEFQVAVVRRASGGAVIYRSNDTFDPVPARADATANLFSVRTQDFSRVASEVRRFTAFASTLRPGNAAVGGRGPAAARTDKRRVSIVIERGEAADAAAPVVGRAGAPGASPDAASEPSWQLILAHHSGSLETAVAAARRRNLLVSTSILGVLGASIALLLLATRRAQRLAQQQMEFVATVSHELRTRWPSSARRPTTSPMASSQTRGRCGSTESWSGVKAGASRTWSSRFSSSPVCSPASAA